MEHQRLSRRSSVRLLIECHLLLALILPWTPHVMSGRNVDEDDRCNRTVDIYQGVESPPVTERNRGRPLHCTYRIRVRPARDDWVVFVRFIRLRIGEPSDDRQRCDGGYVQIVDGYRDSNQSNRDAPGFYCGEIDSPKTFISETPHVKIVFHADAYGSDTYMHFDASVKQQGEVSSRYGQYSQLYPNRRGVPVPNSYCHRAFRDCSPGRCFVQSPGYPGIYPRNLLCKYRISVRRNLVGLDLAAFDVDGLRCDNLLMCFPRPVTRDPERCPYDYVRVYDGPTEDFPLIATLCGRGRLKSNIVATGSDMLVTFTSSPAGPLLNTGFHFKADAVFDAGDGEHVQLSNGSCLIERKLTAPAVFASPRSWYPVNTTCSYKFTAPPGELVRVEFLWFRVERVTLCEEALRIYDSLRPDPRHIITKLCDTNKPRTEQPRAVFESTGPGLLLQFSSKTGSLDGSSISFGFEVRHINAAIYDNRVSPTACNRRFTAGDADSPSRGALAVHFSDLGAEGQAAAAVACNYTFDARAWPHGRVQLTLASVFETRTDHCDLCPRDGPGRVEIVAETRYEKTTCLCNVGRYRTHRLVSTGPMLQLSLHLRPTPEWKRLSATALKDRLLEVSFTFYSDTRCGAERLELDLQGSLRFPAVHQPYRSSQKSGFSEEVLGAGGPLYCRWQAPVLSNHDVSFRLEGFHAPSSNCTTNFLLVDDIVLCPNPPVSHSVLLHRENILNAQVPLEFRSADAATTNFSLWWTQVKILPTPSTPDTLVSLSKECEFLCATSMVCIKKELVCNGVPNCPQRLPDARHPRASSDGLLKTAADEDAFLCAADRATVQAYWWIIGVGLTVCVSVLVCFVFSVFRRCRAGRHRF
ncbi:uncharacterized protein [Dermacentor albipictus]|uniref:uncharacterized protein isoform X2 n=1 Tax=Dermacentor albipictus TaxID=60249 RepID=UPI0031FD6DAD